MNFEESSKYAVVTTGHLSKKEAAILDEISEPIDYEKHDQLSGHPIVRKYLYGWFVFIPTDEFSLYLSDFPPGLSVQFKRILSSAHRQGITYIQFDADGPKIAGLKEYNW
jgi:hypothetical protein